MSSKVRGKIKWFSNDRGYGFATVDSDLEDNEYFVHYSAINMEGYKTLKAGQIVDFVLVSTDKGKQATDVEPVSE